MKSGKQKRRELQGKRVAKRSKVVRESNAREQVLKDRALARGIAVNVNALAPDNSYSVPAFVERGYYVDMPFECKECGVLQTWRAQQQKWWYEIAKGSVWTTARLCRSCRKSERARQEAARRKSQAGFERKKGHRT
jgi:hypothetical protein